MLRFIKIIKIQRFKKHWRYSRTTKKNYNSFTARVKETTPQLQREAAKRPAVHPVDLPASCCRGMELPKVRINALALRNLDSLPFKQLRASSGAAPPTLAARARWLEHGLGAAQALTAAATAALSESVPSALVAPVRHNGTSAKDGAAPAIWIFGSNSDIAQACELLGDAFSVSEEGLWTSRGPRAQTDALFEAISRAIFAALEADGAFRVGSDILDPSSHLMYRFKLVLSSAVVPTVVLRVAVFQSSLRYVDDDDTNNALEQDANSPLLPVVVSPLALRASLSKRRLAGDALSASVLARWKEAGLLPAGALKDSAVIFLRLNNGIEVPFPRACVLTAVRKESGKSDKMQISSTPTRNSSLNIRRDQEVLWRSRKRPRSPSAVLEEPQEQRMESKISETPAKTEPLIAEPNPVIDAASKIPVLSATSFSNALAEAGMNGMKDPTPTLYHPLARTPAPPPPLELSTVTNPKQEDKAMSDGTTLNPAPSPSSTNPAPPPLDTSSRGINNRSMNQTNELDVFGFSQDVSSGFGAGNMDMGDVGSLDDEVNIEEFFGGGSSGMDSDLFCTPLDSSSNRLGSGEGNTNTDQSRNSKSTAKSATSVGGGRSAGLQSPNKNELGVRARGIDKKNCKTISSTEVLNQVLSTIAAIPYTTKRPSVAERESTLKTFYEEDITKRVTDSMFGKCAPSQRYNCNVVCPVDGRYMPSYTQYGSAEGVRNMLKRGSPMRMNRKSRQYYVPKRRLNMYNLLSMKKSSPAEFARLVSSRCTLLESSSDDESDSGGDDDLMNVAPGLKDTDSDEVKLRSGNVDGDAPLMGKDAIEIASGTDASKVAQNVAVDCASACMVLIDEFQRSSLSSTPAPSRSMSQTGSISNGSAAGTSVSTGLSASNGLDAKSPAFSTAIHSASPKVSASTNSYARSAPAPYTHGASQRCAQKKEKDANAFLALLQMQCLGVEGLQLFGSPDDSVRTSDSGMEIDNSSSTSRGPSNSPILKVTDPKPVSTAILRRALHGFSRTIESSKALRSYAMITDAPNSNENLQVSGPLHLADVYGEGSSVRTLGAPKVCIGYSNDWLETSGSILPLWEKSGLEPYSERKNVQYTILAPKRSEEDAKVFFRDVSAAYEECSFGTHTPLVGDLITPIAITQSSIRSKSQSTENSELSHDESAMVHQYSLTIASLSNKLTALRKSSASANNFVVYVVSPFRRGSDAANAALLRAAAPILNAVPGAACTTASNGQLNPPSSSAWRSPSRLGQGFSLHVRIIPYESIDRRISSWMKADMEIGVPSRPQLVKGLAFSVYSSLRSKRLRCSVPGGDKETSGNVFGSTLATDDQMSPMTPDFVADPVALSITPHSPTVSPHGPVFEEGATHHHHVSSHGVAIDQSSALCPSYLHEPAVILAGVGTQLSAPGESENASSMVLHLAYAFCKEASRFVFAWTDSRGEMLDMASVPVIGSGANSSRRRAFWCMWLRGQRWRLPYVESTHVTISKLGDIMEGEVEDWDVVFSKILYGSVSAKSDSTGIVRRFIDPDSYIDHPTPATPATTQHHTSASGTPVQQHRTEAAEMQPHGVKSLTLCTIRDGAGDRLLVDGSVQGSRQDFLCVAESAVYGEKYVQGKALLGCADEDGVSAVEINLMLHYGESNRMQCDKTAAEKWDAEKASEIAQVVAENFHSLRFVGAPPCWPQERWRNKLPLHVELVRNFRHTLRGVLSSQVARSTLR